jgi:hypothetical protein
MKTIKKITLVVLLLVVTISYAEKRNFTALSEVALVEFVHMKKGQRLLVKDQYGLILHSQTIKNNGNLSKPFDLMELKDGQYSLELEKDFEILIKPFEIKNNALEFIENQETKVFKPVMRSENNKLMISQMSLESKPIVVEIYFDNELIYSETTKGEKTMNRVYKLSKFETGDYRTVVKIDNRIYKKQFTF